MFRNLLLIFAITLMSSMLAFSQSGTLKGTIKDKETGEPIPFVNVIIESGGSGTTGAATDFDGVFIIKPITPGKYTVVASSVGYKKSQINDVIINADKITFLDIDMISTSTDLEEVVITGYKVPLISKDKTTSGGVVTSEEIKKMPNKNVDAISSQVGGVFSEDGNVKSVRGQRSEGTVYYIDGIKVTGSASIPESAIDQVSVVLGGVPAQYGDAVGGIINLTTKGPSRKFSAGVSLQTSELLDDFGYNRVGINMNGPLIKKTVDGVESSLLGYYIAGEFIYKADGRPTSTGVYKVKDDVLDDLIQNPISINPATGAIVNNADYLRRDSFEQIDKTKNTSSERYNLTAKFDVKTTPTINLTFGGNLSIHTGNEFSLYHSLFNWDNNTDYNTNTGRAFVRFTKRFKNSDKERALIKNTYLSFQADYSLYSSEYQNDRFEDNYLDYGYVGKFTTIKERNYEDMPTYDPVLGRYGYKMDNWKDTFVHFDPGTQNPISARYTSSIYELYEDAEGYYDRKENIQLNGGLLNSMAPGGVYSLYGLPGAVQTNYSKSRTNQLGLDFKVSTDIGSHEIKFGLSYEQKSSSYYSVAATELWQLMRDLTNTHIQQLDLSNPQAVYLDGHYMDTINYPRLYDGASQRHFDKELRAALGLEINGTEWIDVDSYDLKDNTISYYDDNGNRHVRELNRKIGLDMFSPDELLNNGSSVVYTYGYDYDGDYLTNKPSFNDFFNDKDDEGNFSRLKSAFEPVYIAGYIQDKFAFKDLIFNVGVRVDRYDANQMVLKDPYLLYPAYTAGQLRNNNSIMLDNNIIPSNIGDDYTVYIDNNGDPSSITGFRNGSTWYNSEGVETVDPDTDLDSGNGVQPYLENPGDKTVNPSVFKDYEPKTNVMPRISFSFPISDEALFFAHYDVLKQRPRTASRMDPQVYYFMGVASGGTDSYQNPNLKPEQTIDYELGFQQKLGATSSVILTAFYREVRDQIQAFRYTAAYPATYYSYNNIDFGTIKGLTLTYDLRRTKNIRLKASYTLQFAEGTGTDASSAKSLIISGQPNLRTILPLGIDRRHALNVMLDYRFGEGKNYSGPTTTKKIEGSDKVKTIQWLKNTGINFTLNGGSGTPYTKSSRIYPSLTDGGRIIEGSINGARKPGMFRVDMRLDKDIPITFGKGESKKKSYLNVYLQVLNLFNTMNIMNVYSATGNPDDDGYLAADEWQTVINGQTDAQAYRDYYTMRLYSPYNYSAPRQIRVGLEFNF